MADLAAELLLERRGEYFVDCTLGSGGHSRVLLNKADWSIRLLGLDRDPDAIEKVRISPKPGSEVSLVCGSFEGIERHIQEWGHPQVDGILADFGQSSDQLDDPERGFSYRFDGPLDMRYDPTRGVTADDLVNNLNVDELTRIFRDFGEERGAGRIARAIVRHRPLHRTHQLAGVIRKSSPSNFIEKTLARVFMALRVAVNDELAAIEEFLPAALSSLKPHGRLVLISYDSLQDRRVKDFLKGEGRGCVCPPKFPVCVCGKLPEIAILTKKVVRPDEDEVKINPRSRSAKLRAAEKLPKE